MAAAAGAYSWEFNSQSPHPVIIGEDFQFDFRQHQTLGTVGAFLKYGQRVVNESPTREYLARAIKHARGEIDIATLCPHDEKSIEQLSLNEGPESVNIFELPDFQGMFRRTHREDVCTEKTGDDLCAVHPYFDQRDEHLLWLFIADTPQYPPTIFPSGLVHVPNLFSILALNGKFWATENEAKKGLEINDKKPTLLKNLQWTDSFQSIELVAASPDDQVFGYKDIYRRCIEIFYEPQAFQGWFDSKPRSKRPEFRQGVIAQLQQIDKWLQMKDHQSPDGGQEIRCSIMNLYRMANALLRAQNIITDWSVGASIPGDTLDDIYLETVVSRHSILLLALRELVSECLPGEDKDDEETLENFMRHHEILQALMGYEPGLFTSLLSFDSIVSLLESLDKLLKSLENAKKENKLVRSNSEIIKDVVIWRCSLIYLLFWTAPDNSRLLSSGLWEHVIPII